MKIDLICVKQSDKLVLQQLMELYLYDFSEFDLEDVNEHGHYGYPYLDNYWTEQDRQPFFIKVDSQLAGFVLVRKLLTIEPTTMSMAEFFVMRKYRGKGVGKIVAFEVFEKFPGRWEVRQMLSNKPSLVFWEKVIDGYTQGSFTKQTISVDGGEEQVIIFDNSK